MFGNFIWLENRLAPIGTASFFAFATICVLITKGSEQKRYSG